MGIALVALAGAMALAALLVLSGEEDPAQAPSADVTVTVALDERVRTRGSMNGFIHSLDTTLPAEERVAPLAPRLWRSDAMRAPIDRATAFGAQYQLVLSDLWGYPQSDWSGRGPPWRDLAAWEQFVRHTARAYRDRPVTWDIWNEPNDPGFWSGGQRRFFEVYSLANRVLREELGPDVEIAGPSVSRYAPKWLTAFLDHCVAERCRVGFLSWHENPEPADRLDSISAHLTDGRRRFLEGPRYAGLGLREIHINEYVGRSDRHRPGEAVSYLQELESGGADRAAHSCWSREDCAPAGLDGLLTPGGAPRAVWWAHRWYADGAGSRVRAESRDSAVAVLASAGDGRARVLLGHAPRRGAGAPAAAPRKRVALRLSGSEPQVRVRAERVAAAGEAPMKPSVVLDRELDPEGGELVVYLPPLAAHEAMQVIVEPR